MRVRNLFAALVAVASFSAHALTLPFGFGPGATPTGGSSLAIATSSETSALVGNAFSQTLSITGGTSPYKCSKVTSLPNNDRWKWITPACVIQGTPTVDEAESDTFQVTDATGATAQATFSQTVSASSTLAIVTGTTLGTVANNGYAAFREVGSGGVPPYFWSSPDCIGTNSNCSMHWDGWIGVAPTSTGTITIHVTLTDQAGTTASITQTITANSTLMMGGVDPIDGVVHLPDAHAGSLYRAKLSGYGGSGALTYTCLSSCPSWATITGAWLTGTPTVSGNVEPVIQVADTASHTASATAHVNIASTCQVTRPSYNATVGSGFFVKGGFIYDPNGYCFVPVGTNQTHYDSSAFAGVEVNGALAETNIDRVFNFNLQSASTAVTYANANLIANNIVPLFTMAAWPTTGSCSSSSTSGGTGQTSTICFTEGMKLWVSMESTLASIQDKIWLNICNECAPLNTDLGWQYAYQNVTAAITSSTTTTIHITSAASTNPFANSTTGYIQGSCGATNQVFNITGVGGTSGSWTVTSDVTTSATSGCNLVAGAVGILRAVGYTEPLVIDSSGGQTLEQILNYGAAIQASDPLQNVVFSEHPYSSIDNATAKIASVSTGSTTTITLASTVPYNPFLPLYPNVTTNSFIQNASFFISGATGSIASVLNGLQADTSNHIGGGFTGPWTVPLAVNTTGLTYSGGGTITLSTFYTNQIASLAALRASNVAAMIGEYAVSGNDGGGPLIAATGVFNSAGTQVTVSSMVTGSAPLTPGQWISSVSGSSLGTACGYLGPQTSGTAGAAGVYTVYSLGGGTCNSYSGVFGSVGWGINPGNTLASQIAATASANQMGQIPWSWDDHNPDGTCCGLTTQSAMFSGQWEFTPQNAVSCPGAGCYTTPADASANGQDAMLNPRYGSLALSQKAPYLH